jgi:hypothetical protein
MPNGIITDRGKRRTALYWAQHVTHGAFGRPVGTDPFNPPLEDYAATALSDEIGRAPVRAVRYLMADPTGTVLYRLPNGSSDGPYRYATTAEVSAAAAQGLAPSAMVEFEFAMPPNVAVGETYGEIGLLLDAAITATAWATPAQVTTPGTLFYALTLGAKTIEPDEEIVRRIALKV